MFDEDRQIRWDPTVSFEERQNLLIEEIDRHPEIRIFIESGTADGNTVVALHSFFDTLHTVELVPSVFEITKNLYYMAFPKIQWHLGDTTNVLPSLLTQMREPCFFWLDGHYCGREEARLPKDTPVAEELQIIFANGQPHVIVVDDARLFGHDPAYPTIDWVRNLTVSQEVPYNFSYHHDMMWLVPQ